MRDRPVVMQSPPWPRARSQALIRPMVLPVHGPPSDVVLEVEMRETAVRRRRGSCAPNVRAQHVRTTDPAPDLHVQRGARSLRSNRSARDQPCDTRTRPRPITSRSAP
jgi:hypothetical protein